MAQSRPTPGVKKATPIKRPCQEYDIKDLEVSENATIHGRIVQLSPVKVSQNRENCRYFNGKMSDGLKVARFVSFEPSLRPTFDKFKQEETSVAVTSCYIQESKYDNSLEIKTGKNSTIYKSPKEFKLDSTTDEESSLITVDQLITIPVNQHVTLAGKIVTVNVATDLSTKMGKKLKKQDCVLRDTSASCRIVLWQDDIGKLIKGNSYKLSNVLVRQYEGNKYISVNEGAAIHQIQDIELISDYDEDDLLSLPLKMIAEGEISAILSVTDYLACVSCNGHVNAVNETIGKCTKCDATLKLSKCSSNKSARFIISSDDGKKWQLTAYDEELHLMTINCTGDTILDKLLNTTTLKLTYDSNNVVRNVDIEAN